MSTYKVASFSQCLHDTWWKFSLSDGIKEDVDVLFGKVDLTFSLLLIVAGHNYQKMLLFNWESLNEFLSGLDKGFFEEGDLIVNILLETVSEVVLSFHSNSLSESL